MSKTSNDEAYEAGVRDGKSGGCFDDLCHDAGKVFNTGQRDEIYDKGYQYGVDHRYDSDGSSGSRSGGSGSGSGSGSGPCYITTACVRSIGLSDNCTELSVLRAYRDGVLLRSPAGRAAVAEYYRVAPEIVTAVSASAAAGSEWCRIYGEIRRAVSLVLAGKYDEAFAHYRELTAGLRRCYLDQDCVYGHH
jgi:hypothetical protein